MAQNKKITVSLDMRIEQQARQAQRALENLAKAGGTSLKGTVLDGTSSRPGSGSQVFGGLAKSVMGLDESFLKATKSSQTFAKMMKELEQKSLKSQVDAFNRATKHVDKLTSAYEHFAKVKETLLKKGVLTKEDTELLDTTDSKMARTRQMAALRGATAAQRGAGLQALGPHGGAPPGGGGAGALGGLMGGGLAGIMTKLNPYLMAAGLAVAASRFSHNTIMAMEGADVWSRQSPLTQHAQAAGYTRSKLGRLVSGDDSEMITSVVPSVRALKNQYVSPENVRNRVKKIAGIASDTTVMGYGHDGTPHVGPRGYADAGRVWNRMVPTEGARESHQATRLYDLLDAAERADRSPSGYVLYNGRRLSKDDAMKQIQGDPDLKRLHEREKNILMQQGTGQAIEMVGPSIDLYNTIRGNAGFFAQGERTMGDLFQRRFSQYGLGVEQNMQLMSTLRNQVGVGVADQMMQSGAMLHTGYGLNLGAAGQFAGAMSNVSSGPGDGKQQLRDIMADAFSKGLSDQRVLELLAEAVGSGVVGAGGRAGDMATLGSIMSTAIEQGGGTAYAASRVASGVQFLNQRQSSYTEINRQRLLFEALGGATSENMAFSQLDWSDFTTNSERFRALGGNEDIRRKALGAFQQARYQEISMYHPQLFRRLRDVGFDTSKLSGGERDMLAGLTSVYSGEAFDVVQAGMRVEEAGALSGWSPDTVNAQDHADLSERFGKVQDHDTEVKRRNFEAAVFAFDEMFSPTKIQAMTELTSELEKVAENMRELAQDSPEFNRKLEAFRRVVYGDGVVLGLGE